MSYQVVYHTRRKRRMNDLKEKLLKYFDCTVAEAEEAEEFMRLAHGQSLRRMGIVDFLKFGKEALRVVRIEMASRKFFREGDR